MAIKEHLKDIDFRTLEERQKDAIPEIIRWHDELHCKLAVRYDKGIDCQIQLLVSVLWLLLPKKDFKRLTKRKHHLYSSEELGEVPSQDIFTTI